MTRSPARQATLVLLAAAAGWAACSSGGPKAESPSGSAAEKRDTELTHEDCKLDSSDAKATDANGDKRPDIVRVYDENGREICRAVDINMDTVIDVFIYYDEQGRQRRRESGFDRDTRPDEIAIYSGGVLIRKERETNNDGKIDTWDYYEGGRLVKEERDSSGDGYVDQWWVFNRPGQPDCGIVTTDEDGDGLPDKDSQIDLCAEKESPWATKPKAKPKPGKASAGSRPSQDEGPEEGAE